MNRTKLESVVKASGYKIEFLVKQLGIERSTYYSKISGRTKFKPAEIEKLKYLLHMSDSEAYEIFYE